MDCFTYLSRSGHRITKCFTSWLESCNLCFLLDGRFTSRLSFYAFLFLRPCLAGLLLSTLDFVPFLCILSCEALSDSVCVRCYVNKLYLPRYWRVRWGSGEAASKQTWQVVGPNLCLSHLKRTSQIEMLSDVIWKSPNHFLQTRGQVYMMSVVVLSNSRCCYAAVSTVCCYTEFMLKSHDIIFLTV